MTIRSPPSQFVFYHFGVLVQGYFDFFKEGGVKVWQWGFRFGIVSVDMVVQALGLLSFVAGSTQAASLQV